jgi:hypothetical protein
MSVARCFDDIDITLRCSSWQVGDRWNACNKAQTKSGNTLWTFGAFHTINACWTFRTDSSILPNQATHHVPALAIRVLRYRDALIADTSIVCDENVINNGNANNACKVCLSTNSTCVVKSDRADWTNRSRNALLSLRTRNASSGRHDIPADAVVLILHTIRCVVDVASGWAIWEVKRGHG